MIVASAHPRADVVIKGYYLMIDLQSATPLYAQVKEDLLSKINNDQFASTEKLPSEKELAEIYGVSIITIRRAVSELVEQNVLKRKQGKGTFIMRKPFHRAFQRSAMSFTEVCRENGCTPSAKLLRGEINRQPSLKTLDKLRLPAQTPIVHIERLRYADGFPIVIETTCFSMRYAFLLDTDLEHSSLYASLRAHDTSLVINPGSRLIKIVRADQETAGLLRVRKGTALLTLDGVCFDASGEPLHTSYHIGYSENNNFSVLI